MKKLAIAAAGSLALAAGIAGVSLGAAQPHNGAIKASVSPTKHGSKKHPRNVKLTVDVTSDASDTAYATSKTILHFDKNLVFGGKAFKSCSQAQVQQDYTQCPKGSQVGSGSATGTALGTTDQLTVLAFNGPGGKAIELWVNDNGTLKFTSVIEGTLSKESGKYGIKLTVPIPPEIQQPVPGVYATLTDFRTTVKGTGSKKTPYIGLKGCSKHKLHYKAEFTYTDGTKANPTSTSKCS